MVERQIHEGQLLGDVKEKDTAQDHLEDLIVVVVGKTMNADDQNGRHQPAEDKEKSQTKLEILTMICVQQFPHQQ